MKYKNVLFDLDGTIIDSSQVIHEILTIILKERRLPLISYKEFKNLIGRPIFEILVEDFGYADELAVQINTDFREYYNQPKFAKDVLFDGMLPLLSFLKQMQTRCFIVTNKGQLKSNQIASRLEIDHFFDEVVGSHTISFSQKKEKISYVLEKFQLDPAQTLFIGDTQDDYSGSAHNRIDFIHAGYGYGKILDAGNKIVKRCNSPIEIMNFLKGAKQLKQNSY